jgi:hypothetical protein
VTREFLALRGDRLAAAMGATSFCSDRSMLQATQRWFGFSEDDGKRDLRRRKYNRRQSRIGCQRVEDNAFHRESRRAQFLPPSLRCSKRNCFVIPSELEESLIISIAGNFQRCDSLTSRSLSRRPSRLCRGLPSRSIPDSAEFT